MERLRVTLEQTADHLASLEAVIARKRELFGDDHRLIRSWELVPVPQGFTVRAEAGDPYGLPR